MSDLKKAAQQALEAMDKATRFMSDSDYKKLNQAIDDLRAALAEPQTTHWEGCEAVHPECRKPEQEPIGHADLGINNIYIFSSLEPRVVPAGRTPLYTAPTPRKPLSDEQIALIVGECAASAYQHDDFSFARAIERAHGIGEQHE